ncbi:MAG: hypothetical protein PHN45_07300 [Methylococcales bacterium]|nr:hypothetical protein [Methylococcales bacterium]
MHDYAVFGHDRANIGRWLGVGSLLITSGMSQFFVWANALTGWEVFTKATITTGVVYFLLHLIFNKYAWKIPFFSIPNLNGTWKIVGATLDENGGTTFDWNGELVITQNWDKILIHLRTQNSKSNSYTATLSKRDEGGWLLSYSYKNEPKQEQSHELKPHKGFCEIEIDENLTIGEASYFNSGGRRTFGIMNLTKEFNNG